jgi:hypothetical protein
MNRSTATVPRPGSGHDTGLPVLHDAWGEFAEREAESNALLSSIWLGPRLLLDLWSLPAQTLGASPFARQPG